MLGHKMALATAISRTHAGVCGLASQQSGARLHAALPTRPCTEGCSAAKTAFCMMLFLDTCQEGKTQPLRSRTHMRLDKNLCAHSQLKGRFYVKPNIIGFYHPSHFNPEAMFGDVPQSCRRTVRVSPREPRPESQDPLHGSMNCRFWVSF